MEVRKNDGSRPHSIHLILGTLQRHMLEISFLRSILSTSTTVGAATVEDNMEDNIDDELHSVDHEL